VRGKEKAPGCERWELADLLLQPHAHQPFDFQLKQQQTCRAQSWVGLVFDDVAAQVFGQCIDGVQWFTPPRADAKEYISTGKGKAAPLRT
jgi:hypothetical protein